MEEPVRAFAVRVYEDGKLLGLLSSKGRINRLKIHALPFTQDEANGVAQEITDDGENPYTARAACVWPERRRT